MRWRALLGGAWAVGLAAFASAQGFTRQERAVPGTLDAVVLRDVDLDGVRDLVFTTVDREVRRVGFFRGRRIGGFDETPAHVIDLKPDVVMVAVGDVDPAPGAEFVLFTDRSVFAVRWRETQQSRRVRQLFREPMFFACAPDGRAVFWPHVRDLDGDGADDICVPIDRGFALRWQRRDGETVDFSERRVLATRVDQWSDGERGRRRRMTFSLGSESSSAPDAAALPLAGVLIDSTWRMAAPRFVDANGDGRTDLVLLEGDTLAIWLQDEKGRFRTLASERRSTAKLRPSAPRWSGVGHVFCEDLDRDGRLDFLVRDESPKELRTRLLLFTGGAKGLERPDVILMLSGLTATPRFRDVDGDGRSDLLIPTYRLDLLRGATGSTQAIDVTLHVFLNRAKGAVFGRQPDYSHDLRVRTDSIAVAGIEPMIYLDGDFNRDGRADLLVVDERKHLRVYLATQTAGGLLSTGGRFAFQDEPAVDVEVAVPNRIRLIDVEGDGQDEILLVYERRFVLGGWGIREKVGR